MLLELNDDFIKMVISENFGNEVLKNKNIEDFSSLDIIASIDKHLKSKRMDFGSLNTHINKHSITWDIDAKNRLLVNFPNSFFNQNNEFIAHLYSNTYFIFNNCNSIEDVNCKLLEWFSRPIIQGTPYKTKNKNIEYREFLRNGVNSFLNTTFSYSDFGIIYEELGNAINHNKTLAFVRSGYDLNMLIQHKQ